MSDLVARIIDQVPSDAIVKVKQDECKQGGSTGHDCGPSLSIQVSQVGKPRSDTRRRQLRITVVRPEGFT